MSQDGFVRCHGCHPKAVVPGMPAAVPISTALPEQGLTRLRVPAFEAEPQPSASLVHEYTEIRLHDRAGAERSGSATIAPPEPRAPARVVGPKPQTLAAVRAELRKAAAAEAGAKPYRPHPSTRGLPPLWILPPPIRPSLPEGHNGGPPLEPRRLGRPTVLTPEVRGAILGALMQGVPIRAMATVPGFPHPGTVRRWRAADPEFAAAFDQARWVGMTELGLMVIEEVDANLERHGVEHARWVASRRVHSLAQQAPAAFGGDGNR